MGILVLELAEYNKVIKTKGQETEFKFRLVKRYENELFHVLIP